ncbi:MAG: DUF418 domain-containing protein [Gemmatirosa sp.]|nr:DUF418 domain-containing protein [Gemmatirosa sp.]
MTDERRGPVRPAERRLAPDLTRGAMLLFIALANAPGLAPGGPATAAAARVERVANVLLTLFVQAHTYPVFAIMIGYGLEQIARRQRAAGATDAEVRAVLLRRSGWLIAFGAVHAALLYFADFLGAYGIIGVAATLWLVGRDRAQRVVLWLWAVSIVELIVLAALVIVGLARGGALAALPGGVPASTLAPDYVASIGARLREWPMHTLTVVPEIFIVSLGMWTARRGLLDDLAAHRPLLRRIAVVALGVAVAGAVPLALVHAGAVHADARTVTYISLLHKVSGMFGGPGYVALCGLAALRVEQGASALARRVATLLAALGERSLSGYLFQSLAWVTLLPPYALSLASRFGSPLLTALAVAALTWATSVLGAAWLRRAGRSGPAEALLRRLVYGPARRPRLAAAPVR